MSVQWIEGNVYAGVSGNAITSASGTSGLALPSIRLGRVRLEQARSTWTRRKNLEAWSKATTTLGLAGRIVIEPRDDTFTDVMAQLGRLLSETAGVFRGDKSAFGRATGIPLIVRPITGAADRVLYAPNAVPVGEWAMMFGRDETPTAGMEIVFSLDDSLASTPVPPYMLGTAAQAQGVYFA